jgi:hypothetical protein
MGVLIVAPIRKPPSLGPTLIVRPPRWLHDFSPGGPLARQVAMKAIRVLFGMTSARLGQEVLDGLKTTPRAACLRVTSFARTRPGRPRPQTSLRLTPGRIALVWVRPRAPVRQYLRMHAERHRLKR